MRWRISEAAGRWGLPWPLGSVADNEQYQEHANKYMMETVHKATWSGSILDYLSLHFVTTTLNNGDVVCISLHVGIVPVFCTLSPHLHSWSYLLLHVISLGTISSLSPVQLPWTHSSYFGPSLKAMLKKEKENQYTNYLLETWSDQKTLQMAPCRVKISDELRLFPQLFYWCAVRLKK